MVTGTTQSPRADRVRARSNRASFDRSCKSYFLTKPWTPWRDGTTHLVMSPLEFMQRLAALVPRHRLHLIRFQGVLAPNAKLRALVVPQGPAQPAEATEAAAATEHEAEPVQARPGRISWACLLNDCG
jgi:hypothetical protein